MRYHFLFILLAVIDTAAAQSSFSPAAASLKLFNKYKPVIEKKNEAIVDEPRVITGDINGDQKEDCIIFFVLTPREGGNLIIDSQAAIYLNTGTGMKVVGAFPTFKYCYGITHIKDQIIYGEETECMPPYMKVIRKRKYVYRDGRIQEL